jgi:hypothetical protein
MFPSSLISLSEPWPFSILIPVILVLTFIHISSAPALANHSLHEITLASLIQNILISMYSCLDCYITYD